MKDRLTRPVRSVQLPCSFAPSVCDLRYNMIFRGGVAYNSETESRKDIRRHWTWTTHGNHRYSFHRHTAVSSRGSYCGEAGATHDPSFQSREQISCSYTRCKARWYEENTVVAQDQLIPLTLLLLLSALTRISCKRYCYRIDEISVDGTYPAYCTTYTLVCYFSCLQAFGLDLFRSLFLSFLSRPRLRFFDLKLIFQPVFFSWVLYGPLGLRGDLNGVRHFIFLFTWYVRARSSLRISTSRWTTFVWICLGCMYVDVFY